MADNTQITLATDGDIIATDDIEGIKYQRVKITLGGDGTNDGDASSSNPIPVNSMNLLITEPYDYIGNTYDGDNNITQSVYKIGGASGTVVATIDMTYDESNNCLTITKTTGT
jgi:hypothetical protein